MDDLEADVVAGSEATGSDTANPAASPARRATRAMTDKHVREATRIAAKYGVDTGILQRHIDDGASLDEFRAFVFDRDCAT